jgi:hypothetical protein
MGTQMQEREQPTWGWGAGDAQRKGQVWPLSWEERWPAISGAAWRGLVPARTCDELTTLYAKESTFYR